MEKNAILNIIKQMKIEEKVQLLNLESSTHTKGFIHHHIPVIRLTDGVTGVNAMQILIDLSTRKTSANKEVLKSDNQSNMMAKVGEILLGVCDKKTLGSNPFLYELYESVEASRYQGEDWTIYPSGVNLGSTWDEEIAYQVGQMIGKEHKACGVDVVLGPNLDIQRDPLGGRNYEMYAEDPLLVGSIGSAVIKGIQSTGLAACAKHVAANNIEQARTTIDAVISKRALDEIYLKGFEKAIKYGKVKSIMTAYNAINGEFCSYNKWLLTDMMRHKYGFDGVIVSDWGAVSEHKDLSIAAGMDLILSGKNDMTEVLEAIRNNELSEIAIDEHIERILTLTYDVYGAREEKKVLDLKAIRSNLVDVVCEGAILLKNDHHVLPITANRKTIFWGSYAKRMIECGTGSTKVYSNHTTSFIEEAKQIVGDNNVWFETWEDADCFVYTIGVGAGEGVDREHLDISLEDQKNLPILLKEAKKRGLKTVVILNVAGPIIMNTWQTYADAILTVHIPGSEGGKALAHMLYGLKTPGGKLTTTYPKHYMDTPTWMNFPGEGNQVLYGEGIYVGYRYYDTVKKDVLYPFGYGLSYTQFRCHTRYNEVDFDTNLTDQCDIEIEITNSGAYKGSEVIQIYSHKIDSKYKRPAKELKGFKKVWLKPGETKKVFISLNKEDFYVYDSSIDSRILEVGSYRLYIGTSSRDIFDEIDMNLIGDDQIKLGKHTMFKDIVAHQQAFEILKEEIPTFRGMKEADMGLFLSSPLQNVLDGLVIMTVPDAIEAKKIITRTIERIESLNK